MPIPVSSKEQAQEPEYPSAVQLDDVHWAISTGSGSIYVLETSRLSEPLSGSLVARYDMDRQSTSPFLLRAIHPASQTESKLLLSRTTPSADLKRTQDRTFDLLEVSINPARRNKLDEDPELLTTSWSLRGGDLPYCTTWWQSGWLVLSGEEYKATPSSDELDVGSVSASPTSRPGIGAAKSDVDPRTSETLSADTHRDVDDREWPFSWTQTSDSITMTFTFPAGTKRSDINVDLLSGEDWEMWVNDTIPPLPPVLEEFLLERHRHWYSEIDKESSTFSFDPNKAVLELELVKAHDHSRWPTIFMPVDDDEPEEEVPETLDAKTLAAVRETFRNIKTRGDDEPEGQHPAIPALLREEMEIDLDDDEEFDQAEGPYGESGSKVGRDCFIGYIHEGQPKWTKTTATVLSLPMPGDDALSDAGMIVKTAVDGLLYRPKEGADPSQTTWNHASTSPALAFVLSSKRDIRLVRHLTARLHGDKETPPSAKKAKTDSPAQTTVMAFDAGSYGGQAQGNVYVYYPPTSSTVAKQGVVGVSGRERGALLGVGAVSVGDKRVVLALCEKELVVLSGIV